MAKRSPKWRPLNREIVREQRAHLRNLAKDHDVRNGLEPVWNKPIKDAYASWEEKINQFYRNVVLYAAALGQKQGKLPSDLSKWHGQADWDRGAGAVVFTPEIDGQDGEPITITVRYLDWSPAPPIDETIGDSLALAA